MNKQKTVIELQLLPIAKYHVMTVTPDNKL